MSRFSARFISAKTIANFFSIGFGKLQSDYLSCYRVPGPGLRLGIPLGICGVVEFPFTPAFAAEPEGEEFMELPSLAEAPLALPLTELLAEFIALIPGLLGTSEPAGPGTEPATGAELLAPILLPVPVPAPAP